MRRKRCLHRFPALSGVAVIVGLLGLVPSATAADLTVTTSGAGSGTVTGKGIDCGGAGHTDCSETGTTGTSIELTATPANGNSFGGYTGGGCGAANPCTVTLNDQDEAVDARFNPPSPAPVQTLTVTTSGAGSGTVTGQGIDCGGAGHTDCSETVPHGTAIALTATAASGSTFIGYTGGGCGVSSACTVTLDIDKALDARFTTGQTPPIKAATRQVTSSTTPKRDRTRPYTFTTRGRVLPPLSFCAPGAAVVLGGNCVASICPTGTTNPAFCKQPARALLCAGVVTVRIKRRGTTVSSRSVSVRPDCTYRSRATFRSRLATRRGTLTVRAGFAGNTLLLPKNSSTRAIRAG